MTDVASMFWDNLPAICFGALGAGLVWLVVSILADRRTGRGRR